MEFLISEAQLRVILKEQDESKMNQYMKKLYSFTNDLVNKAKKNFKLNLKLLLTWGAAVGGLVLPLDDYLKSGKFNLTENQKTLILIGIACTYFFDNEKMLKSIYTKIKEEGIDDIFKETLLKSKNLKDSFLNFISSLNVTLSSSMDLVAYSFLIPVITDIQKIANQTGDIKETALILSERFLASGVVIVSSIALTKIITKILKRLK
jgi:hypothetical protein